MKFKPHPSQERLHELFEYRDDGNLIRKESYRGKKDEVVGKVGTWGYLLTSVDNRTCQLHRLIFMYHHGYLTPKMVVDHINGIRTDNRIENLREITYSQNRYNSKLNSRNACGVRGVYFLKSRKKWKVIIKVDGKDMYLGLYLTLEEAAEVSIAAQKKYFGEFYREE
jgi:hypothetical protein